ncbi:MAG: PAS domain S-box protein, partial [Desulfobacteraceae bacterium]|nr:PAS domain S-box protein [Desulfobacteraceae bacterium]
MNYFIHNENLNKRLLDSERKFRILYNKSPDMYVSISPDDASIQLCNETLLKKTGYSREDIIGTPIYKMYHDDCIDDVKKTFQQFIETGVIQNKELILKRKDGTKIDVTLNVSAVRNEEDQIKYSISSWRDITKFKKSEKARKESEEKYRSMMEAMDDATYICSSKYIVEYMNPAMIKKIGQDAIGKFCHKVIHGLDKKCPWCVFEKIIKGESISHEITSPKDNRTYHISNSPVFQANGSVSKLTIFRDVTDFRKMETQLQQAQRMESIGTLAGGIAHDFNNILFPIAGHTEMLLEDVPEDSPFKDRLNKIYTGTMRASELVKQILTFSRQDINELKLMNIQPIIKEALKLIRSTIPTTIEIKQDILPDCGAIKADPTQIHQIIMNLATNSYHAMEDTGGELKVSLKE